MSDDTKKCTSCGKINPTQAKFCSGCRTPLIAMRAPPYNFNAAGNFGAMGGKPETRQYEGVDPSALYAAIIAHVQGQKGAEIKHQTPPAHLSAGLVFKDFMLTMGAPVRVDSEISITAISPSQSLVSVVGKVDASSTATIWMVLGAAVVLAMISNPYTMLLWGMIGIACGALGAWLLWSRAPRQVAEDLFNALRDSRNFVATPAAASHQGAAPPPAPPAPSAEASVLDGATPINNPEDETFARLRKLAELKNVGAITVEEFESKKTELLSRI